jgi:hypothetical protein
MNRLYFLTFLVINFGCSSYQQRNNSGHASVIKKTYIEFNNRGLDASIKDSVLQKKDWHEDNILDSMTIYYSRRPITVRKLSNYPKDPIDGGYVAYQEESLGVFYIKTCTWKDFIIMRTDNDSINRVIDILIGSILANSNMYLTPRQEDILRERKNDTINRNSH